MWRNRSSNTELLDWQAWKHKEDRPPLQQQLDEKQQMVSEQHAV